jgi:hypothetical protein
MLGVSAAALCASPALPQSDPSGRSAAADPRPVFGINVNRSGPPRMDPVSRLADFGRIPMARGPYYGLDALPPAFDDAAAKLVAPERRLQMSFKRLPARILDGSYDRQLMRYLNSIPPGWTVGVTYWHEPNAELASGVFSAADFKAAWYRIGRLIGSSTSRARLIAMPNYTGPAGARFHDSWVVRRASMPTSSILTWDKYGNPPPKIDALPNMALKYRGLYPRPRDVFGATVKATVRLGWTRSWAISEFNTPRRLADPQEVERRRWFVDAVGYLTSRPAGISAPRHLLVWEGQGTQFDQRFVTTPMRDALRPYFQRSP